jgi:hypothetical protein
MEQAELNRLSLGDYAKRDKPHIYPEKFWTDTKDNPSDPLNPIKIDMVRWVKRGAPGSGVVQPISRLQKSREYWDVIGPFYDAWKKGHETPTDGTPLSAWPGCRPEEAERFNMMRIYTVQDVAAMTDGDLDRFGMGARDKRAMAIAFLEAGDKAKIAAESEQLKRDLDETRNELKEAMEAIKYLKSKIPGEEIENPAPRRGRPPKAA